MKKAEYLGGPHVYYPLQIIDIYVALLLDRIKFF